MKDLFLLCYLGFALCTQNPFTLSTRGSAATSPAPATVTLTDAVTAPDQIQTSREALGAPWAPAAGEACVEARNPLSSPLVTDGREVAITFLLGQDAAEETAFGNAATYFREHRNVGGQTIITDLRTTAEVRDYLAAHPHPLGWRRVNLVVPASSHPSVGDLTAELVDARARRAELEIFVYPVGKATTTTQPVSRFTDEDRQDVHVTLAPLRFVEGVYGMEQVAHAGIGRSWTGNTGKGTEY